MAEQFWLRLDNDADAVAAETKLASIKVGQERAFYAQRDGNGVFVSCSIHHPLPNDAILKIEGSGRGMHHPDGMLWVRHAGGSHKVHQERVPLLSVAPRYSIFSESTNRNT
jgi:hypothetical protein